MTQSYDPAAFADEPADPNRLELEPRRPLRGQLDERKRYRHFVHSQPTTIVEIGTRNRLSRQRRATDPWQAAARPPEPCERGQTRSIAAVGNCYAPSRPAQQPAPVERRDRCPRPGILLRHTSMPSGPLPA